MGDSADEKRAIRRAELQRYARVVLIKAPNKCEAMYDILLKAVSLAGRLRDAASAITDDLEAVMIGEDMLGGRGKGKHYCGSDKAYRGADGFKEELRYGDPVAKTGEDTGFQVQHAIAGLVIGFRHGAVVQAFVKQREAEPQDDRLYDATFPVGEWLRGAGSEAIYDLPERMRRAVCKTNAGNTALGHKTGMIRRAGQRQA